MDKHTQAAATAKGISTKAIVLDEQARIVILDPALLDEVVGAAGVENTTTEGVTINVRLRQCDIEINILC